MGWLVRLATTAAEGLDWINSGHEPCCLILDLDLPDGRGEEVLEKARAKGLRTHVAVCTGIVDQARLSAVERMKPDVFLTKPVTASAIWDGVCRVSEGHEPKQGPSRESARGE
jgi:FixJ family two-component response regulator